jgi:hypothetical protein
MPSNIISQIFPAVPAVGIGATVTFDPGVGKACVIKCVGSDQAFVTSGANPFLVSDVEIGLTDGVDSIILNINPVTEVTTRYKKMYIPISHEMQLTLKNTSGAPANISIFGEYINYFNFIGDIVTIPGGGSIAVDPGNIDYAIRAIGSDVWTAGPADINPDVQVGFQNAAATLIASIFWDPTQTCGHDYVDIDIGIRHDCQLLFTGAPGVKVGYVGQKASGRVISFITDVATGIDLPVRPPVNEEWRIRHFAAEKWGVVGPPVDTPNITVSLKSGANLSNILEAGLIDEGFFWNPNVDIDFNNYLNINNADAADNEIAVIGYATRQF